MKYLTVEQIQQVIKEKIPANLVTPEHTATGHWYRHSITGQKYASVTTKCGILDAPHLKKWSAKLAVEYIYRKVNVPNALFLPSRILELKESAILAHQDEFEEAGDIGTRGHKVIEEYLLQWMETKKRPDDIRSFIKEEDPRIWAIARSAEKFCREFGVIPVASEMFVASTKYSFAGTLDSLMLVSRVTKKGNGSCDKQLGMLGNKKEHDYWRDSSRDPSKLSCKDCGQKIEIEFSLVDWKTSNSIDKVEYAMQTAAYWQALKEMTGLTPKRIYVVRLDKAQAKYDVKTVYHRPSCFSAFKLCSKLYDWLENGQEKMVKVEPKERVELNNLIQINDDTRTGSGVQEIRGAEGNSEVGGGGDEKTSAIDFTTCP